ncbi:type VII secretion protein EsaA [Pseudalkalibacillus decolorationis]|uniref:type VII secretion protein EsaA n=1 Tax=Pseudalkalibacillus decolorationis TaxID=163879 RepID=UPI0021488B63|nr:type VII secretion protein EsaA [Pseudalkalibacillus decolorationis]
MTEKASLFKLVLAVLMILTTPLVFFQSVGENPMKVKENATQSIAIVNEDTGTEEGDEDVQFGEDVTSILKDNSDFNWAVVSRSAGENGLRDLKYDAIVYIPSDFSDKIMSYDEQRPVKTNFQYKVQSQLNAVNKQKVLLEIEQASDRVNSKISSLYWNYVSADMENIREEFDEILEKEVAFQQTMLSFYKPSSKNLAGQLEQQQAMLESLQASIQQQDKRVPAQKSSMEAFDQNLTNFVEYVKQYRKYQENQQQLLAEIQSQSIKNINTATEAQQPRYLALKQNFVDAGNLYAQNLNDINTQMGSHNNLFDQLEEIDDSRKAQLQGQSDSFYTFQEDMIDYYQQLTDSMVLNELQTDIIRENGNITEGSDNPPPDPVEGDSNLSSKGTVNKNSGGTASSTKNEPAPGDSTNEPYIDLKEEREELISISEKLTTIQQRLITLSDAPERDPNAIKQVEKNLARLNDRILGVETDLEKEESKENPLQDDVNRLKEELETQESKLNKANERITYLEGEVQRLDVLNGKLIESRNKYQAKVDELITVTENKEQSILESAVLSDSRKDALDDYFAKEINSQEILDIVEYYDYLSKYEGTLNRKAVANGVKETVLQDEKMQEKAEALRKLLETEDEAKKWDDLGKGLPTTYDALTALEDSFTAFIAEYEETIVEQHGQLMNNLTSVQKEAETVLNQIQQPQQMLASPPPQTTGGADGPSMLSGQDQIGEQLASIHTWMDSISENQGTIVNYTTDLQGKVAQVQQDANTLNDKWSNNVASTELIRDDVFGVLGNTFVDGQSNGYVYNFLSNPLKISGSVPTEEESANVPPVVVLFIILLSSLMIGYTSYYFQKAPYWMQGVIFLLLNLIVGFVISLFGLKIYPLGEQGSLEWTVFTILLLLAGSALVRVAFSIHQLLGWFISVGLIAFFVTPLLALTTPNFNFSDPMSEVYMSIQYGTESLFTNAVLVLAVILIALAIVQLVVGKRKALPVDKGTEANEAM